MNTNLSPGVYRFNVTAELAGLRLDQLLAAVVAGMTRGMARRLVDLGGVHIDGRRVRRCSLASAVGQGVEVHVDGYPLEAYELRPEQILFHDRHLLALDKPAGIATQPTPARYQGTLYAALQKFLGGGDQISIGMVQRLDRDTSGVIVFSIHPKAHKGLTAAFSEHHVVKRYLALVSGTLAAEAGEFRSLLARRHSTNLTVSVARGGKPAVTRYRVLASSAGTTLVSVEIPTGRSHQIRAHFSEAGHPLLGDTAYGGPKVVADFTVARQMLHAGELQLTHPVNKLPLVLRAPPPADFQELLHGLGYGALPPAASPALSPTVD